MNDDFTEVGGGSFWGTKDEPIKPGDTITGQFVGSHSGVGPNNSMTYTLRTEDGDMTVWGATTLDGKMDQVQVGATVRITFVGLSDKPGKFGKPFKVYKVESKAGPKGAVSDAKPTATAASTDDNINIEDLPY